VGAAGEPLAIVVGAFGAARESVARAAIEARPAVASSAPEIPYVPGVMPAFTQHFAARWLEGDPPFAGVASRALRLELGLRDEGRAGEVQLVALADFAPPIALSHLRAPAPGSTLAWMLELLVDPVDAALEGWRIDATLEAAREGYTHQSLVLWAPDGRAAALSRQTMLVFG
jgi:hypothetical protein